MKGVSAPSGSNCPVEMAAKEKCQAICHDGIAVGSIQCFNGQLNDFSICAGSAQVSVHPAPKVFGTLEMSIAIKPSQVALASGIADALGVNVSTVDIWLEVNEASRRLLRGSTRRLADTEYRVKYEVLVVDEGPSEAQILSRAAALTMPNSSSRQQFDNSMATSGLTVTSLREVFPPLAEQSVALFDGYGEGVVFKSSVSVPSSADVQEHKNMVPLVLGFSVGGFFAIIMLLCIIWYRIASYRNACS